jgi:putative Ca2+/H+ antiporter (TMEM165/GDT1 family)
VDREYCITSVSRHSHNSNGARQLCSQQFTSRSNLETIESNNYNILPNQTHQKYATSGSSMAASFLTVLCLLLSMSFPAMAMNISPTSGTFTAAVVAQGWVSSFAATGFYQAFSLVFLSEIGDKTFFIAGLLAMKTSRFISFVGSTTALAAMTIVSVIIGQIFHAVPAGIAGGIPLDDVAAVLAFAFFGFKTLKEALEIDEGGDGVSNESNDNNDQSTEVKKMKSGMDEELAEAQEVVNEFSSLRPSTNGNVGGQLVAIFALVFAAEFGDRSFLSTIALSAAQNPISVAGGAIAAHAVATGIAVAGGAYVSKYISERVIGIIIGTLFLLFAVTTAFGIF